MNLYNKPFISKYLTLVFLGMIFMVSPNLHGQSQSNQSGLIQKSTSKKKKMSRVVQGTNMKRTPTQYTSYYYECHFLRQVSEDEYKNVMSFNIRTPDRESELVYNESIRSISISIRITRKGVLSVQVREYGQDRLTAFKKVQIQGFDPLVEHKPPINVFLKRQVRGGKLGYSLECR